jgi:cellobiose dehydrogenase (acceptor)
MIFFSLLALLGVTTSTVSAQAYTDAKTGIKFWQSDESDEAGPNGFSFGVALPAASQTQYQDEYIGHLTTGLTSGAGWGGLSHGPGMTGNLLVVFWPNGNQVVSSFRYATGYVQPTVYTGNATLTIISSTVNSTHLDVIYRCQNCWVWSQGGVDGSQVPSTASGQNQPMGWAQHTTLPSNPADPASNFDQHAYYDIAAPPVDSMRNSAYTSWIAKATAAPAKPTGSGTARVSATASATPTSTACASPAPTDVYDYIVAGAGAGGIPIAAKLSEGGKKVLLIERGPPSSGRYGGTMKPTWLGGTNLTRFDVPGLCNEIWVDSVGIACPDASAMAGCVLGGGTAINAGLWWKPNPLDFDYNFPAGWRSAEVNQAITRVFQKIPGTYYPSLDGKTYIRQGFNSIVTALAGAGWASVDANANPGAKNRTYSQTPYMFSHGERGGPMATYLVEASARSNFKLIMNTSVKRIVRTAGHATGVEVEPYNSNGLCGTIKLSAKGRVIVSAGVFGTSKILMRSGIGPTDQLNIVKASADGPTMINSSQWLNLPVGYNLGDHTNVRILSHCRYPLILTCSHRPTSSSKTRTPSSTISTPLTPTPSHRTRTPTSTAAPVFSPRAHQTSVLSSGTRSPAPTVASVNYSTQLALKAPTAFQITPR